MQVAMTRSSGIIQGVFDDPYQQWPAALLAAVILGIEVGQIGAIGKLAQVARHDITGQATQHMRPQCTDQLDQARRVKATIEQHQHAGLDRAQQGKGSLPFIGKIGAKEGRPPGGWRIRASRCRAPADRRQCHVGCWADQRSTHWQRCQPRSPPYYQSPSAATRRQRLPASRRWHGLADALEQATQRPDAQLLTTLADGTAARQAHAWLRPDVAQSLGDLVQDVRDRHAGKEAHRNDEDDDHRHIERLFALFPALGLSQHVSDESRLG